MTSVSEILLSNEFKTNDAVLKAIDLLDNTLSLMDNDWDDACLEAWQFDELTDEYPSLSWGCGATKVAVIFKNFVLKATYNQTAQYEFDEELGDYTDDLEYEDWRDSDYCWIESRIYEEAVKAGIGQFFAPTFRVGDTDVYIQAKADSEVAYTDWCRYLNGYGMSRYEKRFGEEAFDELRYALKLNNISRCVFSYWLDTTSYMQLKRLGEFLNEHCINDLHNHNIGWFGDKILLFDYSGYQSNTEDTI